MSVKVPVLKKGEYPHARGVVQVVDDAAIAAILGQEIPPEGLLFDFDHYSDLTNHERAKLKEMGILLPSDASGWIHGFTMGDDGNTLYATVDWTEAGERAVKSGAYKYPSPVFPTASCEYIGGNRVRPKRISKVALTNEPNMKAIGPVLANREPGPDGGGAEENVFGPVYETAIGVEANDRPKKENHQMDEKLTAALGLEKDATVDAAVAAIDAIKSGKTASEAKTAELETQKTELANRVSAQDAELKTLREAKAKAELDANVAAELAKYPNLPNREAAETLLRANFDAGKAFLATMPNTTAKSAPAANAGKGANPEDGASLKNREGEKPELHGAALLLSVLKSKKA